ncbi:MAG: 30S ribosomal protein S3 [Candidatus Kerfeldbacteria bacterium]|nr:30S ribosomal protein S3 [Candidatus Kerfeldbacteria bacterium]
MGQKVHPRAFRIGILHGWKSKWFSRKDYRMQLEQDVKIRKYLLKKLREAGIAETTIERSASGITVNVHTSKPGVVIGRGGTGAEELKKEIQKKFLNKNTKVTLNIHEVTHPFLDAQLVTYNIIEQLEKRIPFRRAGKRAIEQVMQAGAKGVKIIIKGRLNGAEIARDEKFGQGSVPLHTLRADIDYSRGAAHTTYGMIGVKVWIYKGEVFEKDVNQANS